jgi:hypothetical protein
MFLQNTNYLLTNLYKIKTKQIKHDNYENSDWIMWDSGGLIVSKSDTSE